MKKSRSIIAIILIFAVIIPGSAVCASAANRQYGDVNNDGAVDAADARLVLRYAAGLEKLTAEQRAAADVNNDGETNSADTRLILRYIAGLQKEFAAGKYLPGAEKKTETALAQTTAKPPATTQPPEIISGLYKPVVSTYAYGQLSDNEKAVYRRMKDALLKFVPAVEDGMDEFDAGQIEKICKFVLLDSPEIFWAVEGGNWSREWEDGVITKTKYKFMYILNEPQKVLMQNKIDATVNEFFKLIRPGLSEYERVLAVYEYINSATDYNTAVMNKFADGVIDYEVILSQTIASVFANKNSVCAGYSKATQYLLNRLGVFCLYISGHAKGPHAWNMVKIDGDFYLLDTTWGNPASIDPSREKILIYNYFCLTDAQFNKTHTPEAELSLPVCKAAKYDYFIYNDLYLKKYDAARIEKIIKDAAARKKNGAGFKFADDKAAAVAMDALFNKSGIFDILKKASAVYPSLSSGSILYSFDPDTNVINIRLFYS